MTHPSLHQDGENINSDRPRCRGVSAILRRATGHQPFGFAQGRERGWKGGQHEPDDSAEHAAMVNASEGVMRRRQGEPACSGYQAGPKGNGSTAWFANRNQAALDTGPGVKHRPKAA
jgi:hypothetical protein